ncbi:type II asparaginase [Rubritalea tangerina]|uniref:Type II asparaginase n=1 Tax=Rubritalea tangerina TaxID=430798 RepID=A0ABW4Z7S8_9BACT
MKRFKLSIMLALFCSASSLFAEKPNVVILATGGTIAGKSDAATSTKYTAGQLPIEDLLAAVPGAEEYASIKGEQVVNIGSQAMNDKVWLTLAKRCNELLKQEDVDGIVITHGTDTKEATGYFLNLTVKSDKPIVLVSSMRNSTSISADGPKNLFDGIITAAAPESKGMGVLVASNDYIYAVRDLTKTNTTNVATMKAPNWGPIGVAYNGKPYYYHKTLRKHTTESEFDVSELTKLPKVDIVYGYSNMDATAINAFVENKSKGLIFVGVGNGNIYPDALEALKEARKKGVVIVRASRTGSGRTTLDAEVDDKALGFVVADDLNAQKARVLLMLALTKTNDLAEIQKDFFTY